MSMRDDVLRIMARHMGPAAGPFLERQCKQHLKKEAAKLVKADLPTLAKWVKIGTGLILGEEVGADLAQRILTLGSMEK
jgi:hypothetical protein